MYRCKIILFTLLIVTLILPITMGNSAYAYNPEQAASLFNALDTAMIKLQEFDNNVINSGSYEIDNKFRESWREQYISFENASIDYIDMFDNITPYSPQELQHIGLNHHIVRELITAIENIVDNSMASIIFNDYHIYPSQRLVLFNYFLPAENLRTVVCDIDASSSSSDRLKRSSIIYGNDCLDAKINSELTKSFVTLDYKSMFDKSLLQTKLKSQDHWAECLLYNPDGAQIVYWCGSPENTLGGTNDWFFLPNGEIRVLKHPTECLEASSYYLYVDSCDGKNLKQKWVYTANHEIKSMYNGKCLDVQRSILHGNVILYPCNGDSNQKWSASQYAKNIHEFVNSPVRIKMDQKSVLCLGTDGKSIQNQQCVFDNKSQLWFFSPDKRIVSYNYNKCLEIMPGRTLLVVLCSYNEEQIFDYDRYTMVITTPTDLSDN